MSRVARRERANQIRGVRAEARRHAAGHPSIDSDHRAHRFARDRTTALDLILSWGEGRSALIAPRPCVDVFGAHRGSELHRDRGSITTANFEPALRAVV